MDDLATLATNPRPYKPGPQCSISRALQELPPEVADLLRAAIQNRYASESSIQRAVAEYGVHLGVGSVGRHRRGVCRCATT